MYDLLCDHTMYTTCVHRDHHTIMIITIIFTGNGICASPCSSLDNHSHHHIYYWHDHAHHHSHAVEDEELRDAPAGRALFRRPRLWRRALLCRRRHSRRGTTTTATTTTIANATILTGTSTATTTTTHQLPALHNSTQTSPSPGPPTHNLPSTHNPAIRPRPSHSQHTDPPIPHQIDAVDSLYRDESDDVFEGNGCAYGLSGVECDRFEYINCPAVGGKEDF